MQVRSLLLGGILVVAFPSMSAEVFPDVAGKLDGKARFRLSIKGYGDFYVGSSDSPKVFAECKEGYLIADNSRFDSVHAINREYATPWTVMSQYATEKPQISAVFFEPIDNLPYSDTPRDFYAEIIVATFDELCARSSWGAKDSSGWNEKSQQLYAANVERFYDQSLTSNLPPKVGRRLVNQIGMLSSNPWPNDGKYYVRLLVEKRKKPHKDAVFVLVCNALKCKKTATALESDVERKLSYVGNVLEIRYGKPALTVAGTISDDLSFVINKKK